MAHCVNRLVFDASVKGFATLEPTTSQINNVPEPLSILLKATPKMLVTVAKLYDPNTFRSNDLLELFFSTGDLPIEGYLPCIRYPTR